MLDSLLLYSVTQNASDVHLSSGEKPMMRQLGQMVELSNDVLDADLLESALVAMLDDFQREQFKSQKQLDFSYQKASIGRFRVNVFYQYRGISAVFRVIKNDIPTLDDINAPAVLSTLMMKESGLILVAGATGSGKSTTLAAMIQQLNQTQAKHIITLEDPIEFIYQNELSLIQQRQLYAHYDCFPDALFAVLRQDPDVILIGELRDKLTIQAALTAAETGHLVLATLHTNSAIATINRIVDVFEGSLKEFIRMQLASSLLAVICQKLDDDNNGGRKANFEILINTPAVSNLIIENKNRQIESIMQTGQQYGMKKFD